MNQDLAEILVTPELLAAFNLVKARCREDGIRLALIRPPVNLSPENPFPTEWSHRPLRHDPDSAIPPDFIADRERDAIARAFDLARRWSEENDFTPPLHRELSHNIDWHVEHHQECAWLATERPFCDCGYLMLVRYANRAYVVNKDGSLEPFISPPPTIGDLQKKTLPPFFLSSPDGSNTHVKLLFGLLTNIVTVGEGEEARILSIGEDEIQEIIDSQPNQNVENERYAIATADPR